MRTHREGSEIVVGVFRSAYAEAQAVCVRRLVDHRKGTCSLSRLVSDMAQNATVLTRERYVAPYRQRGMNELGEREFDRIGGEGADHLSRKRLHDLRSQIETAGEVVKRYVDERIAHEQREAEVSLNFGQLKDAIHKLSEIYTHLGDILTGSHLEPAPTILNDWHAPFRDGLFPLPDD